MMLRIDVVGGRHRPTPHSIAIARTDTSVEQVDEVTPCEFRRDAAVLDLLVDAVLGSPAAGVHMAIPGLHLTLSDGVESS
jgi:hypothetical protein